ncbi:MAG: PEGA domain-containing protein, partial [Myxococcales bacterium]|nr:PEGA domain-containing protein [Myxococcales bacterium]
EGEPRKVSLLLAREQGMGRLSVVSKTDAAAIEIDGKVVGADRWEGPVTAGTHQIVVKKKGFYTWSFDVDVKPGGERTVTAQLNEDRNTSFVPWLVGTIVVLGGGAVAAAFIFKPKDQDPVTGNLPPGIFEHSFFKF